MNRTRTRRDGFTLMEVITAITVTALVATVAAAALRAGLDVRERVQQHRLTVDAEARATEWLATMLRHPPAASAVNEPMFSIAQAADGSDSVTFLSQGVDALAGTGGVWRVTLHTNAAGLHLYAMGVGANAARVPLESVLPHVVGLRAAALSAATTDGQPSAQSGAPSGAQSNARSNAQWLRQWPVLRSTPAAVRLSLVLRNGLERAPLVFPTTLPTVGAP